MPGFNSFLGGGLGGENPIGAIFGRRQEANLQEDALEEQKRLRKQQLALGIAGLFLGSTGAAGGGGGLASLLGGNDGGGRGGGGQF